jgi:serine/threonine protein kinase
MKSIHKPGTLLGNRYRLVELAGKGGMAEVWRGELIGAEGFKRPVAVKRVLRALLTSKDHRQMFIGEAQLTAMLDHPNVVQVYDFGEDEHGLYLAMEWVEGLNLLQLLRLLTEHKVKSSCALMAAIGIEMLRGLEAAHENVVVEHDGTMKPTPIIHRDVSPSNVMLSIRGIVKLADFGLARALNRAVVGGITPAGVVKGKLAYMAPEVLRGKPASAQSDVFSAGVVLWEAMAGRRLHGSASEQDIVMSLIRGEHPPALLAHRADAPAALAAAVDRALETDPARRYQSASEFARALSDVLRTIPERTDTSRLSREVTGAVQELRRAAARASADDVDVEVSGARNASEVLSSSWLEPTGDDDKKK